MLINRYDCLECIKKINYPSGAAISVGKVYQIIEENHVGNILYFFIINDDGRKVSFKPVEEGRTMLEYFKIVTRREKLKKLKTKC